MSIDILLPTYNGSKYIRILLDSLFGQTYTDWHLYVRDDHSKDDTLQILEEYRQRYPEKMTILDNGNKNIGINKGFSFLLSQSKSEYACFCDQDDKWMADKLQVSINAIKELEAEIPDKPCLVYSDLTMVDEELHIIAESRWKADKIKPHYLSVGKLLMQNPVNGCVMIMNRRLVELAHPVPEDALWFDHWVSVVAAAAGKVRHIPRPTIYYRIHEFNASRGENRVTRTDEEDQVLRKLSNKNFNAYFSRLEKQARAVQTRIKEHGYNDPKRHRVISDFLRINDSNAITKRWIMWKHRMFKHTWASTAKWFLRI